MPSPACALVITIERACRAFAAGAGGDVLELARKDVAGFQAGEVVVLEAADFDAEIDRAWSENITLADGKRVRNEFAGGGKSAFRAWAAREGAAGLGISLAS